MLFKFGIVFDLFVVGALVRGLVFLGFSKLEDVFNEALASFLSFVKVLSWYRAFLERSHLLGFSFLFLLWNNTTWCSCSLSYLDGHHVYLYLLDFFGNYFGLFEDVFGLLI